MLCYFVTKFDNILHALRLRQFVRDIRQNLLDTIQYENICVRKYTAVDDSKGRQSMYMPIQASRVPGGQVSQISRQSTREGNRIVSPMHRPHLPLGKYSWYSFLLADDWPQGHSAARRIMSMKNSNDTIGNRIRNLSACSAVPQPETYISINDFN
jgi:hypothetical protein